MLNGEDLEAAKSPSAAQETKPDSMRKTRSSSDDSGTDSGIEMNKPRTIASTATAAEHREQNASTHSNTGVFNKGTVVWRPTQLPAQKLAHAVQSVERLHDSTSVGSVSMESQELESAYLQVFLDQPFGILEGKEDLYKMGLGLDIPRALGDQSTMVKVHSLQPGMRSHPNTRQYSAGQSVRR